MSADRSGLHSYPCLRQRAVVRSDESAFVRSDETHSLLTHDMDPTGTSISCAVRIVARAPRSASRAVRVSLLATVALASAILLVAAAPAIASTAGAWRLKLPPSRPRNQ